MSAALAAEMSRLCVLDGRGGGLRMRRRRVARAATWRRPPGSAFFASAVPSRCLCSIRLPFAGVQCPRGTAAARTPAARRGGRRLVRVVGIEAGDDVGLQAADLLQVARRVTHQPAPSSCRRRRDVHDISVSKCPSTASRPPAAARRPSTSAASAPSSTVRRARGTPARPIQSLRGPRERPRRLEARAHLAAAARTSTSSPRPLADDHGDAGGHHCARGAELGYHAARAHAGAGPPAMRRSRA